jgi:hypothetical protein
MAAKIADPYAVILLGRDVKFRDFWERSALLELSDNVEWIWVLRLNKSQPELLWVMPRAHLAVERPIPQIS